jgi:hypothetical protein
VVRLGGWLGNLVFGALGLYVFGFHGFDAVSALSFQNLGDFFILSNLFLFASDTMISLSTKRGDLWQGAISPLQSDLKNLLDLQDRVQRANSNKDPLAQAELLAEIMADGDRLLGSVEDIAGVGPIVLRRINEEVKKLGGAESYAKLTGLSRGRTGLPGLARGFVEAVSSRSGDSLEKALERGAASLVLMDSMESVNWRRVAALLEEKRGADILVVTPNEEVSRRLTALRVPVVLEAQEANALGIYQVDAPALRNDPVVTEFVKNAQGLKLFHTSLIQLQGLDRLSPTDPLRLAGELAQLIDQALQLRRPPTAADWHNIFSILEAVARFA